MYTSASPLCCVNSDFQAEKESQYFEYKRAIVSMQTACSRHQDKHNCVLLEDRDLCNNGAPTTGSTMQN